MKNRTELFSGTQDVRPGLEFDVARLEEYMADSIPGFVGPVSVEQFKGGQSNPTYKINTATNSYTLRRKPPGKLLPTAHAIDREYRIMSALKNTKVPVPQTYTICEDQSIIGTSFYIMEFVDGRVLWEPMLPNMRPAERRKIYANMNSAIAKLHTVDFMELDLSDYGRIGNSILRQIRRWSRQYLESNQEPIEELGRLCQWLPENLPCRDQTSIVHGDFRIDNMIFQSSKSNLLAIVDWELSTLGDPVGDFVYHLMQWRLPANIFHGLRDVNLKELGIPSEEEYVRSYCEGVGREDIPHLDYYMAYCMFRLSAILHGILVRVKNGTASSSHATAMSELAKPLAELAWDQVKIIEGKSV